MINIYKRMRGHSQEEGSAKDDREKKIKVRFIKPPVKFRLAYFPGDIIFFPEKQARELIRAGVAVDADEGFGQPAEEKNTRIKPYKWGLASD